MTARHHLAVVAAFICLAAGCASTSVNPAPAIARAEGGIDNAKSAGARQDGAKALDAAESKLTRAKLLAQSGDDEEAVRLAEESRLDAELATAQAGRQKSEDALGEIEASIAALKEEISRAQR